MISLTTESERCSRIFSHRFNMKLIATAVALTVAPCISAASPSSSGDTLQFELGTEQLVACSYGTTPPCVVPPYNVTDIVGSYFGIDANNSNSIESYEKTPIGSFNGIIIGEPQPASGSHSGPIDGSESPDIDYPWEFFGNTGMHQTISAITVLSVSGNTKFLDMNAWQWLWNGISVPMTQLGDATVVCETDCSNADNYTLDAAFHVAGGGFTTVPYVLHLEGMIAPGGPVVPTKQVSIQLTDGNSHECSEHGGDTIQATASIVTTDTNDIASVNWELDGERAGSGNAIDVFTPLGDHTLSVFVDTLASGSFQSSESLAVSDKTPPDLDIRFIDRRSGQEITEVSSRGNSFVTVMYDVTDICDPEPTASGVAVPVHAVGNGDTIKIKHKKSASAVLDTTAVNVSADAADASGNQTRSGATLLIHDH